MLQEFTSYECKQTLFSKPFTIKIETKNPELAKLERYLNLYIQIPRINDSSVVVLEGDFTGSTKIRIDGFNNFNIYDKGMFSNLFYNSSLLRLNDGKCYAYDSDIIQYLLNNVISTFE